MGAHAVSRRARPRGDRRRGRIARTNPWCTRCAAEVISRTCSRDGCRPRSKLSPGADCSWWTCCVTSSRYERRIGHRDPDVDDPATPAAEQPSSRAAEQKLHRTLTAYAVGKPSHVRGQDPALEPALYRGHAASRDFGCTHPARRRMLVRWEPMTRITWSGGRRLRPRRTVRQRRVSRRRPKVRQLRWDRRKRTTGRTGRSVRPRLAYSGRTRTDVSSNPRICWTSATPRRTSAIAGPTSASGRPTSAKCWPTAGSRQPTNETAPSTSVRRVLTGWLVAPASPPRRSSSVPGKPLPELVSGWQGAQNGSTAAKRSSDVIKSGRLGTRARLRAK